MLNLWSLTILVFVGTLASLELGARIGLRDKGRGERLDSRGVSVIERPLFALLGLLLAFSFSGAAARFEARRHLITTEVNAISTAWLRLDLLPNDAHGEIRQVFREYADLRGRFFRPPLDAAAVATRQETQARLEAALWQQVIRSLESSPVASHAAILLIPALNAMFDIASARLIATTNHPPQIIPTLLIAMTCLAATLAGYGLAGGTTRNIFHRMLFALVMTATIVLITELEYPRQGYIRIDAADEALIDLARGSRSSAPLP